MDSLQVQVYRLGENMGYKGSWSRTIEFDDPELSIDERRAYAFKAGIGLGQWLTMWAPKHVLEGIEHWIHNGNPYAYEN